jgi:hypothetical protein
VAVKAGNMKMCQELLDFGAEIDNFGIPPHGAVNRNPRCCICTSQELAPRTPLMLAAELGSLTLVRLFMDVYSADDALIAPDSQIALRLAASNGHREIVNYLPARRGGGWQRWKKNRSKAMKRINKAGKKIHQFTRIVVLDIPALFMYALPRGLVEWLWSRRQDIPRWIGEFVRWVPEAGLEVLKWVGRILRGVPHATAVVAKFLWRIVQAIGKAIVHAGKATFGLLHSLIVAVVTFFSELTLRDLFNGLVEIFRLPIRLWDLAKDLAESILKFMKALFGLPGEAVTWLFYGILWVIVYIPRKLWEILAAMGGSLRKAFKELLVLVNPRLA